MMRDATVADAARIARIYNRYVAGSIATFETEPLSAAGMAERIDEAHPRFPWRAFDVDGQLVGYAYAAPWKSRAAYAQTVETSVYVAHDQHGRGVGEALMRDVLDQLRAQPVHTALAGIALPNDPCVRLHEKLGFSQVAQFKETGYKFGRWIDVGYWQLIIEDRPDAAR